MKIEEMKQRAADHLECYAEMMRSSGPDSYTYNYLRCMIAGALAILEDLEIITAEDAKKIRAEFDKGEK